MKRHFCIQIVNEIVLDEENSFSVPVEVKLASNKYENEKKNLDQNDFFLQNRLV